MNVVDLKEMLGSNTCHIHKHQPTMTILVDGILKIETCCLLFKKQLHLLVNEQDEKYLEGFPNFNKSETTF